jgi:hypothetical protein
MIKWLLKVLGFTAPPIKQTEIEPIVPVEQASANMPAVVEPTKVKKTRKPRQRKAPVKK